MVRIHPGIKSVTAVALAAALSAACGSVFGTREYDGGRRSAERATGTAKNSDEIRQVQQKLNDLNYGAGPVDGVWGKQSAGALRDFQHARGLEVTGQINDRTLRALQTTNVPTQRQAAGAERQPEKAKPAP
jgi:peptidoglycan hydrolase-like protein with peptidoglycan-binding domain